MLLAAAPGWSSGRVATVETTAECAGPPPCVVVDVVDGTTTTSSVEVSTQQLVALQDYGDVSAYVIHGPSGDIRPPDAQASTTLRTLVQQAVPDLSRVTFTEVLDSSGGRHTLARDELGPAGASGFPGGLPPVVFPFNTDTLYYVRTARDANDLNGPPGFEQGVFLGPTDRALHVVAHVSGALLEPSIDVTEDQQHPSVFTFSVADASPGLTYSWTFGDTTGSTLATPSHDYGPSARSSYPVTVEVSAPDGSYGQGQAIATLATAPSSSGSPTPGGTTGPTPTQSPTVVPTATTTTGPPTEAPTTPAPTTQPPTPHTSPTATSTLTIAPTTPGTPSPTPSATPTPSSPASTASASAPPATPTTRPPPSATPSASSTPAGSVVGLLLEADALPPAPPGAATTTTSDPPETRASSADSPLRIGTRVRLALVVVLLLGAGAASEARGVSTWLRHHRTWSRLFP